MRSKAASGYPCTQIADKSTSKIERWCARRGLGFFQICGARNYAVFFSRFA